MHGQPSLPPVGPTLSALDEGASIGESTMPTYEYACKACGHRWELVQRITEDPVEACPACGAPQARRLISQGNFILKGGGWYADLYSGSSNKKGQGNGAGDGSTSKESGGGGSAKGCATCPASGSDSD